MPEKREGVTEMAVLCPRCGGKLIGICYGYPTYKAFEKAEQGKVFIGGCMIKPYVHHCNHCGVNWSEDFSQWESCAHMFCQDEGDQS